MTTKTRNTKPVAVAGGGIGGLATALGLAQRGFRVIVLEQARQFGEVGVGLQVAPNALAVLDALGVGQRAKKDAFLIERMLMKDGVSGETIVDIPCDKNFIARFGNPYAVAHRADIHGSLLEACEAHELIELRTSARVAGYDIENPGVTVALASGERIAASALVGADGVYSSVRRIMLNDGDPFPSGYMIYRAVIDAADMPKDQQFPYPTLWCGERTHLIYYPVRDWKMYNFAITVHVGDKPVDESTEAPMEEALANPLIAAYCEAPLRVARTVKSFRRWVIRRREPASHWSTGPVTLLGDGAHPMVQFIAQGAAAALEDAICLAVMAEQADGDFTEAFKRYEATRIVRASRVQISSWMMNSILHAGGVERLVRNSIFAGRTPQQSYDRLSWLYTSPEYVRAA